MRSRSIEIMAAIKNTFEPVIQLQLYARSQIDISVLVIQQDGSVLSAAINAVTLALMHAGIALTSPVSSVSLSCLHDTVLLDPCTVEENDLPTLTVACLAPTPESSETITKAKQKAGTKHHAADEQDDMESVGKICLVNMETRLSIDRFENLLKTGARACRIISQEIDENIRAWAEDANERLQLNASSQTHVDDLPVQRTNRAMDEDD